MSRAPDVPALAEAVKSGDRRALSQAITLVESTLAGHRERSRQLLEQLLPAAGGSRRIGITGAPGAGKSSLIESLGVELVERGRRLAVLTIDPTSQRTGGSILGDKTRMERLSRDSSAFVRPSPSGGSPGGVARRTRESTWLCEAAGYDTILVETVGVGQGETAVSQLVDTVVLVAIPGAGDELQGIKRGVMETADILAINKADLGGARQAAAHYSAALRLLPARMESWRVPVVTVSARTREGLPALLDELEAHHGFLQHEGRLGARRAEQGLHWFERLVEERLKESFFTRPEVAQALSRLRIAVQRGERTADSAAAELLRLGGL
ncbi:MAG: methylmalonyl Co-A mutase-associated GTPase MeaB [Armatimonadetes bacterium]|nr:methylmalonyl Co-A mutase-associated GTPase MeaB [Armatimonadota bacterium]